MNGWVSHRGHAVCLPLDNIDTDQLIPARFMSQPRASGYGHFLLHDLRYEPSGQLKDSFILNRIPNASVLICGNNFGCGSSREAAVYALLDAGVQVVLAPSFGDIFTTNAVNNGLLPARITAHDAGLLQSAIGNESISVNVSLNHQTLSMCHHGDDQEIPFQIENSLRIKLINGWDDIDLTLNHSDEISAYREQRATETPWTFVSQVL